eukprot:gnl/TRDRNA2_/TRDRNA2_177902_c0_seq1.p1 gnl/TRDRNA2_/TRDRNA2_177902_c0~~gnl/TRDRNA2_/TRDRNA2_177902_c0_seq1.p1  ORF type:complete len:788 (+),score=-40.61 gnl/TRDRNA2_/TRDRNA2_177902_c0_seq1:107-2470(+)
MLNIVLKNLGSLAYDYFCFLLTVGNFRMLLDCGSLEQMDEVKMTPLLKAAQMGLHCVILSHSEIQHLGALPMLIEKIGYTGPVYGTDPVLKTGSMYISSSLSEKIKEGRKSIKKSSHINQIFNKIRRIRYRQFVDVETPPPDKDMPTIDCQISAHKSEFNLGGTIWQIKINGEDIIYAPKYHINNKSLIDGPFCFSKSSIYKYSYLYNNMTFFRPTGLLASIQSFKDTDNFLVEVANITLSVLRCRGNVMIPLDSVDTLINIILYLGNYWLKNMLPYNLVLFSPHGPQLLETIKRAREFTSTQFYEKYQAIFESKEKTSPLKLLYKINEFHTLLHKPTVALVTPGCLQTGYSKKIFNDWAANPQNAIIVTHEENKNTLNYKIREVFSRDLTFKHFKVLLSMEIQFKIFIENNEYRNNLVKEKKSVKIMEKTLKSNINSFCKSISASKLFQDYNESPIIKKEFPQAKDYRLVLHPLRYCYFEKKALSSNISLRKLKYQVFENTSIAQVQTSSLVAQKYYLYSITHIDYFKMKVFNVKSNAKLHLDKTLNKINEFLSPQKFIALDIGKKSLKSLRKYLKTNLNDGDTKRIEILRNRKESYIPIESDLHYIELDHDTLGSTYKVKKSDFQLQEFRGTIVCSKDIKKLIRKEPKMSIYSSIIPDIKKDFLPFFKRNSIINTVLRSYGKNNKQIPNLTIHCKYKNEPSNFLGNASLSEIFYALMHNGIHASYLNDSLYYSECKISIDKETIIVEEKKKLSTLKRKYDNDHHIEYKKIKKVICELYRSRCKVV